MKHIALLVSLAWYGSWSCSPAQDLPPLPDVRGHRGALILDAMSAPSRATCRAALALARGARSRVLPLGPTTTNWRTVGGALDASSSDPLPQRIDTADLVWIERPLPDELLSSEVKTALLRLLDRGGVLGASAQALPSLGSRPGDAPTLALFPNATFLAPMEEGSTDVRSILQKRPGTFAVALKPETRCLLRGRRLQVRSEGEAAVFQLDSAGITAMRVRRASQVDWVQQARIARTRTLPPHPAKEVPTPDTGKGTVIAVGGGRLPRLIVERFIAAAGGADAPIVVIPTAQGGDPLAGRNGMIGVFRQLGVKDAVVIHARTPEEATRKPFLDALRRAKGIWFGGGRQWRLVDAYAGTAAHALMRRCLEKGGVIGGSSAGATISGDFLVRGSPLRNTIMMAEGYERGLGFLQGVAIDQHFTQRRRFDDMRRVHARYPQLLGFGIDEGTAIVVKGTSLEVLGDGRVAVYDGSRSKARDHRLLRAGDRYDLARKQPRK